MSATVSSKTRSFTVKYVYKSEVSARLPSDWGMTQPDPPRTARFTDPTGKRWYELIQKGGQDAVGVATEVIDRFSKGTFPPALASLPVVFATAKASPREAAELIALGAAGVISKPFSPKELPAKLRAIWELVGG